MMLSLIHILLSGHSNFAYAQKAIELGVTRYLLKPTNPRELISVLEGIEKELNQGREAAMDGKQLSREAEAGPAAVSYTHLSQDSPSHPSVFRQLILLSRITMQPLLPW